MSHNIFFASDHHFGHVRLYTEFKNSDGTPARCFASNEEATEAMVERHNKVVRPQDRVYFLGDVLFHKRHLPVLDRMTGRKVLIKGNHDILTLKDYGPYFDDVRAVHQFKGVIMSHIPIHPDSLARWGFNVHGHTHNHRVYKEINLTERVIDDRYFCVSMEQINYTPISLEDVKKHSPNKSNS